MRSHTFGGQPLDRMDGQRAFEPIDPSSPSLRVLPVSEGSVLVTDESDGKAWMLSSGDLEAIDTREITLLGSRDGTTYAFVAVEQSELERLASNGASRVVPIRSAAQVLDRAEASIIAYAHALASWQRRSRHCGSCGSPAQLEASGHRRQCSSPDCGEVQFPRTDPSVIGIVSHGDQCLLVNQPQWAPDRFATIAGFVEPGESLEEAMAREIHEEVGLTASEVRYHSSQPWPFPMSLMIGFEIEATSREPLRLSDEIRAAMWLTRDELRGKLSSGEIGISPPLSISFALIAEWFGDRAELAALAARRPWGAR